MAVKYQVFVSSTFSDLIEERQVVSRSILEMNHIPAGMELFPAFDQAQLDFIKRVIDDCDYYILIIGGRYGSVTEEGISFTEAEYDYAVEKGKPVIALLHADLDKIESGKVEKDKSKQLKLEKFKDKVSKGRLVKFWSSKDDLKSGAIISLTSSFDQNPQVGWRRNDQTADAGLLKRLEDVRERSDHFRQRAVRAEAKLREFEEIGDSEVEIKFLSRDMPQSIVVDSSEIVREFAPLLKRGFTQDEATPAIKAMIEHNHEFSEIEVLPSSVDATMLYFEVFDVAEFAGDFLRIREDKVHLLRSAFKKARSQNTKVREVDEIPF